MGKFSGQADAQQSLAAAQRDWQLAESYIACLQDKTLQAIFQEGVMRVLSQIAACENIEALFAAYLSKANGWNALLVPLTKQDRAFNPVIAMHAACQRRCLQLSFHFSHDHVTGDS